jgi:hypothetical protein
MAAQSFVFKVDVANLKKVLATIMKSLPKAIDRGMADWAKDTIIAIKARNKGAPGTTPRSGTLNKSWTSRVDGKTLDTLVVSLMNSAVYAHMQNNQGWTNIVPRKAQALTIPTDNAKFPGGRHRWKSVAEGLGQTGLLFFVPKKNAAGRVIGTLCGRRIKGIRKQGSDQLIPYWILVKSVQVPGRMGADVEAKSRLPQLLEAIGEKIAGTFNRGRYG